jgi:hypothetical protein
MKKTKIIGAILFSLLLLSTVNLASAAPPSYVGFSAGQEYIWTPTINFTNINTTAISLVGADNWTLAYAMLEELLENETGMTFDMLGGLGLRMTIHNVTDELIDSGIRYGGAWFNMDVSYTAGIWTRVVNATDSAYPMIRIINPADVNESTYMYLFSSSPFMPIGLNYTFIATQINNYFSGNPYYSGNMSIAVQGNGFQITIYGDYLEMMLESMGEPFNETTFELNDVIGTIRYNNMGILEYASVSYGGLVLASAALTTGLGIPGFTIPLILGISAGTLITIIVIVKKKNKIII